MRNCRGYRKGSSGLGAYAFFCRVAELHEMLECYGTPFDTAAFYISVIDFRLHRIKA